MAAPAMNICTQQLKTKIRFFRVESLHVGLLPLVLMAFVGEAVARVTVFVVPDCTATVFLFVRSSVSNIMMVMTLRILTEGLVCFGLVV